MAESPISSSVAPPLFSVRFSYVLAVLLVVPFLISILTTVEPFPAMVFPAGRTKLTIEDGRTSMTQTTLSVEDAAGGRHDLSLIRFLDPIPLHYFQWMLRFSSFGFSNDRTKDVALRYGKYRFPIPRHVSSKGERRQLRRWIAARVRAQGLPPGTVLVTREHVTVDVHTGKIVERETLEQTPLIPE